MRSWVTRQNSDVHAHTILGEAHKPFHRCAGETGPAGRGIDLRTDAGAHDAAGAIYEIPVKAGVMIGIFFEHMQVSHGRTVPALAGGDWAVDYDLLAGHEIGALFGK